MTALLTFFSPFCIWVSPNFQHSFLIHSLRPNIIAQPPRPRKLASLLNFSHHQIHLAFFSKTIFDLIFPIPHWVLPSSTPLSGFFFFLSFLSLLSSESPPHFQWRHSALLLNFNYSIYNDVNYKKLMKRILSWLSLGRQLTRSWAPESVTLVRLNKDFEWIFRVFF